MKGFPERLRAARHQLGLTQEQLAAELHVTKASVSAWERDAEKPGFRLLPQLRAVLGVSLDALVLGEGEVTTVEDPAFRARNETEARLLRAYRRLPSKRQEALLNFLD